jgi:hypothetical protein
MRGRFCVGMLRAFLTGLMPVMTVSLTNKAIAADPVTLEVYEPTGAYEVTQLHAPRLATLHDKTICEVASYNWEWDSTFAVIRDSLKKQFPTVKIIPWDKMNINSRAEEEDHARVARMVKEKGGQGAIIGNAG